MDSVPVHIPADFAGEAPVAPVVKRQLAVAGPVHK